MKKTLYIFSSGELHRKQNTIYFLTKDGKRKYVPVENTGEIYIFGEVSINKKLLEFVSQQEIILHFFNHYGYYVGSFYPREHYNSGFMILKQAEHYSDNDKRLKLAIKFVFGSAENMKKVLQYYISRGVGLTGYAQLDVAEIFKPIIVDRVIFYLLNKKMLKPVHFIDELKGIYLNEKGRKIFVEELDKRLKTTIKHRKVKKIVSYRRLIRLELYKLEKHMMGEKEYEPFEARW